jgi:hypothetical protein
MTIIYFFRLKEPVHLVKDGIKPIPCAEGAGGLVSTSRRRHVLHVDIHKLKYAVTDGVSR